MRKKIWIAVSLIIVVALVAGIFTKPSDKDIKLATVKAVWGNRVPSVNMPQYFEQFMNLTAPNVLVDDWGVMKRIRFIAGKDTVFAGVGIWKQIWLRH